MIQNNDTKKWYKRMIQKNDTKKWYKRMIQKNDTKNISKSADLNTKNWHKK